MYSFAQPPRLVVSSLAVALLAIACKHAPSAQTSTEAASASAPKPPVVANSREWLPPQGPALGVISGQANIYVGPTIESRRLGYLRLGAVVGREKEPVHKAGCPGGWYPIAPRGFVCAGEEATVDMENLVLRAAAPVRPDQSSVMPYRYGFVRAVLPLYLKIPSREEQLKAEFKLKEHLTKWAQSASDLNKVSLGSYDVPLDERGVPVVGKQTGDVTHPSTSWNQGELFGAKTDKDPIPFWLEGGRKIPNVADFKVPPSAIFADRARRHTGLAFAGSFPTGPENFERRFAITTDLRLAPVSKVKPDTGSPWHGLELIDPAKSPPLPFAWVRTSDAKEWKLTEGGPRERGALEKRSVVLLTGKKQKGPDGWYWEIKNGLSLKGSEAGVIRPPDEWPDAAKKGTKWIEVSIENQTLTLWEGQKPVYATLVSTGQDGIGDPKTTKSTVRGVFTIRSKHITATMDSNERSGAGGGKRPEVTSAERDANSTSNLAREGKTAKAVSANSEKRASVSSNANAATSAERDSEYGVTKRRGEGAFWLRDVPYVQYFESGYALHVAYWHDVFGVARSHGCINLSPIDGRWIFSWTDPPVPEGWHGVLSGGETGDGTVIVVHE